VPEQFNPYHPGRGGRKEGPRTRRAA
jgi:hypothetical protein